MSETLNFTENKSSQAPHNDEAEKYLLSCLLIDSSAFDRISDLQLKASDFFLDRHKTIFEAILALNKAGKPVDIITLNDILKTMGISDKAGGADYITSLLDLLPTSANIEYYGKIIKEKSMLRQLINVSSSVIAKSLDNPDNVKSLIDSAEKELFDISQETHGNSIVKISDVINKTIQEIINIKSDHGDLSGIPSGYSELDEKTDGFQKQEMVIIAARPSAGKTSFALNLVCNAALRYNKRVGFFSAEMGKESLVKRMLSSEAGIDQMALRKGILSNQDREKLSNAAGRLFDTTIIFEDTASIQILELRSKARRMKKDFDIEMLVIDYLQLLTVGDELGKNTPRHEQIGYISRSLKALARELNIPVLALAQLNRNLEGRGDNARPKMSDLKDSGSIEQDADVIMFIHRLDYNKDGATNNENDIREIVIGKNRNGPTDIIKLLFQKGITRFKEMTKDDYPEYGDTI